MAVARRDAIFGRPCAPDFVTRFVPRHLLQRVAHLALQAISRFSGDRYEDPINGKTYRKFLSYGRGDRTRPNAWRPTP